VAPAGKLVEVVRGQDLVLRAKFEELQGLLVGLALENVEIFNYELIFLGPTDTQAGLVFVKIARFLGQCESAHAAWIEQVEDLLVVYL